MDTFLEIQQYIANDIDRLNKQISEYLNTDQDLINLVGEHLSKAGGKKIRPMLVILSSKMFGYDDNKIIKLAAAVEFIHMATILHDDVVDDSKIRRSLPAAHTIWGNKITILVGDFLFGQSFKLMILADSMPALKALSNVCSTIISGELRQLSILQKREIMSNSQYMDIIQTKTATLFSVACEIGGLMSCQNSEYCLAIKNFGNTLGIIFQIVDDTLDYFGDAKNVGKNIGDDFAEGKFTLPIIILYDLLNDDKKNELLKLMHCEEKNNQQFLIVKNLLTIHDIKSKIYIKLGELKNLALSHLKLIEIDNKYKQSLINLMDYIIEKLA